MMTSDVGILHKSSYLYIAEGSIAIAVNLPLTIAILSSKQLRERREFRVLIGLCIADGIFGLAFLLSGVSRVELINENDGSEFLFIARGMCSKKLYTQLIAVSLQLQGVLLLAVAMERFFGVFLPITYFKSGARYGVLLVIGPYVCVAIATGTNFALTIHDETPVEPFCLLRDAVDPKFHTYILLDRITGVLILALLYVAIIAKLLKFAKKDKVNSVGGYAQKSSMRRSTITVGCTTANAFVFLLIQDVINITGFHDLFTSYSTAFFSFSMTNVILNALILFFRHREIRDKFKRLLRWTSGEGTRVVAIAVSKSQPAKACSFRKQITC